MSLAADRSLRSLVDRGDVEGVFFFHGDAERLRDDAARALVEAAIDPATRDFNLDTYRASEVSSEALAASLAMPPVMAPRRVVALFGAERLTPTGCGVIEKVLERTPPELAAALNNEMVQALGAQAWVWGFLGAAGAVLFFAIASFFGLVGDPTTIALAAIVAGRGAQRAARIRRSERTCRRAVRAGARRVPATAASRRGVE